MNNANIGEYDKADFQGVYQGKTLITSAEITAVPWEIGRAQPAVCKILDHEPLGKLLDAGCGLGHNAQAAAEKGFQVTAIDSSSAAIERCRQSAHTGDVRFLEADACATRLDETFDVIVDSALYHAIPADERGAYLQEMKRLSHAKTSLHVITFAPSQYGMPLPLAVQLSEIAANAENNGWQIAAVSRVEYKGNAEAISDFSKKKNLTILLDEEGLTRLPCWHVVLNAAC